MLENLIDIPAKIAEITNKIIVKTASDQACDEEEIQVLIRKRERKINIMVYQGNDFIKYLSPDEIAAISKNG